MVHQGGPKIFINAGEAFVEFTFICQKRAQTEEKMKSFSSVYSIISVTDSYEKGSYVLKGTFSRADDRCLSGH